MLQMTDAAKNEIIRRRKEAGSHYARLEIVGGCSTRLRVVPADVKEETDVLMEEGELKLLIAENQQHYATGHTLDFAPDTVGFHRFIFQ